MVAHIEARKTRENSVRRAVCAPRQLRSTLAPTVDNVINVVMSERSAQVGVREAMVAGNGAARSARRHSRDLAAPHTNGECGAQSRSHPKSTSVWRANPGTHKARSLHVKVPPTLIGIVVG